MASFLDLLKSKNIIISFENYDSHDLVTNREIKSIVERADEFNNLLSQYRLIKLSSMDDYYKYLFILKIAGMREIVPQILQDEHKKIILKFSDNAQKVLSSIKKNDLFKFINGNIHNIFDNNQPVYNIWSITLELIAKYNDGISSDVFAFLCKEYGYLLINRFEQFEKVFEKKTDLFEFIYSTGHLNEINSFGIEKTLDIWFHILNKRKSNLKEIINKHIAVLAEDIKLLNKTVTDENIIQVELTIREFLLFLQRINSPMANEFTEYAKVASDLLSKSILKKGHYFQYKIPVEEIISNWKEIEDWQERLLSITHNLQSTEDAIKYVSMLSKEPKAEFSMSDLVGTNVPTDDFFTLNHQYNLWVIAKIKILLIFQIISKQDTLLDYLNLVASSFSLIIKSLNAEGEQLHKDVGMFSALVQLVANNLELNNDAIHGICYGASMYMCALAEKLLRVLYLHLAKDEQYIPINKATIGQLLSESNTHLVAVFGKNHIKNLSYFLHRTRESNIGQDIRNSLAHWANFSSDAMTPYFMAQILWIFTDILNTIFLYCLENVVGRHESDDHV